MEEIKLSKEVKNIEVDLSSSDITINGDETAEDIIVKYPKFMKVDERGSSVSITEDRSKFNNSVNLSVNGNGISINSGNGVVIIGNCASISKVNGQTIINGNVIDGLEGSDLEIVIPKSRNDIQFVLETSSGDVVVSDLSSPSFEVEVKSGDIKFYNIDILKSNISTMSGDVKVKINQFSENYDVSMKTLSGDTKKKDCYGSETKNMIEKRYMRIKTLSGDIKVSFNGRQ